MMKKTVTILFLSFMLSAGTAYAQIKAPDGFRDVKLGQEISTVKDAYKTKEAKYVFEGWTEYYKRHNEKMTISDIKCDEIEYLTFLGKIYQISITSTDPRRYLLKDIFIKLYGSPQKKEDPYGLFKDFKDNIYWNFNNGVKLSYTEVPDVDYKYALIINYTLLELEHNCHQYMKNMAEEDNNLSIEEGIIELE